MAEARRPPTPRPDQRLHQRATGVEGIETENSREDVLSGIPAGLWAVFARMKYLGRRLHGPRAEGQRIADLAAQVGPLLDVLEATWRAGYKSEDLLQAAFAELKRRGG